jgi:protein ImuB
MSVAYCAVPHFATALARRDDPDATDAPLVLVGPEGRVLDVSAEAAAQGVASGMTARTARIRCPEARLLEADVARCRAELESLFEVLEQSSPRVEPHGWGGAYVDVGDLAREQAVALCRDMGQAVRRELGQSLQPALGWDSTKFTAQAAAVRTLPGRLRAVEGVQQQSFLRPLTVTLLPLAPDTLRRLGFLGLRTLGQYADLSPAAVGQQFGPAGKLAQRCARGQDDRPVVARWQAPVLSAEIDLEAPLVERERLLAALRRLVAPLLAHLRARLQACGQVTLAVRLEDGNVQERARAFLSPVAEEACVLRAQEQVLDGLRWQAAAAGLAVTLSRIQDAVAEQLTLFPLEGGRQEKLREVQRYLAARFGTNPLRRAVLAQPGAPLPEWRVGWQDKADL